MLNKNAYSTVYVSARRNAQMGKKNEDQNEIRAQSHREDACGKSEVCVV